MSKLSVLDKIHTDVVTLEILGHLRSQSINIADAYQLMCQSFKTDLESLSVKANTRNISTLSSYVSAKLFPESLLSKLTISMIIDGSLEPISEEPEFVQAVPRGCAIILDCIIEDHECNLIHESAQKLLHYIEGLGVLPKSEDVIY